jgi:hypothetical protein
MLLIEKKPLPRSELVYVAFRLAFCETRERLVLSRQMSLHPEGNFGFLAEVPFLRNVPPQVQLDLLLETWCRHVRDEPCRANLADESVLYAVCETASRIVRRCRDDARRYVRQGPLRCSCSFDYAYADRLQKLHLNFANEGHFLLLSQFQDIPPDESASLKRKYGIDTQACECLFEVLGRWHVRTDVFQFGRGLLTEQEMQQTQAILHATDPIDSV